MIVTGVNSCMSQKTSRMERLQDEQMIEEGQFYGASVSFLPFTDSTHEIRPHRIDATALSEGWQGFHPSQIRCPQNGSCAALRGCAVWCLNFRGQMKATFLDFWTAPPNTPLELTRGKHRILIFSILSLDYEGNDSSFLVKCNTLNFPVHTIYSPGGSCGIQN